MATCISDNPELVKTIKQLETLFLKTGGWLHEDLLIREREGELSLETPPGMEKPEPLVSVPAESLIPLKFFDLNLAGDEIILSGVSPEVSPLNREIFEIILKIFNLTKKIKTHRIFNPWPTIFTDERLFEVFRKGRPDLDFIPEFRDLAQKGDKDSIVLKSFFRTRPIDLLGKKSLFMPVLDFANHHFKGQVFKVEEALDKEKNLTIFNAKPVSGCNEVFVKYHNFDALDLFMIYGFADDSSTFVRSIPFTLKLPGLGEVEILDYLGIEVTNPLPPGLENLRFYLPKIIEHRKGFMKISHLFIPGAGAPKALRRVLANLLPLLDPEADEEALQKGVIEAERQVVQRNIDYYETLKAALAREISGGRNDPALAPARTVAEIQLFKLTNYHLP